MERKSEKLGEREDKYRVLVEESSDPIFSFTPEGRYTYVNRAFAIGVGKSVSEIIGKTIWDVFPKEEASKRFAVLSKVFLDGEERVFEVRVPRPEGSRYYVTTVTPVKNSAGNVVSAICSSKDITERKRTELAVLESEKKLREIATNFPGAIYQFILGPDEAVTFRYVSEGAGELFERPSAEIMASLHTFQDVHPDDMPGMWASIRESARTMAPWHYEFRIVTGKGKIKWLSGSSRPVRFPDGGICWNGVLIDISERKQMEQALRESEEKYRLLFEAAGDAIFIVDEKARILEVNSLACERLGYSRDELLAMSVAEVDAPAERPKVPQRIAQSMSQERPKFETVHQRKDGYIFPVEVSARRITWEGRPAFISICRDITDRKRAEEMLEKRIVALTRPLESGKIAFEELFNLEEIQRIQDEFALATGVASIITHPDGTPLTTPSNFTRLCGEIIRRTEKGCANCFKSDAVIGRYHPEGPIVQACLSGGLWDAGASITVGGQHIANWLIGQVRDETQTEESMRAYARQIGADEPAIIKAFSEVPAMSRQQFQRVAQALFTLASQLSTSAYQNVQQARFISERNRATQELIEEQQLTKSMMESLPGIFYLYSYPEMRLIRWNKNHETLLGFAADEVKNRHLLEWHVPEAREAVIKAVETLMEKGQAMVEASLKAKDGRLIPFLLTGVKIEVRGKSYFVGVGIDLTERKQAEAEMKRVEMQLLQAQKLESVGRLAGGVAHDFNNMLGVILGHAEMAMLQVAPEDPLGADLQEIIKAASRSAELTRQLLAFARKQTVAPKVLDLNQTVAGMLKMLQRLIGEDVHLRWKPESDLWLVKVDPSQIDQILVNLCVNSRDAITDVGNITIETGNVAFTEAYCHAHQGIMPGEYVRLAVSDDGCGMDPETLSHVFEPFFTTKGLGKGTGLGLATVYGAVRQNNGFVVATSELKKGTTIAIHFPRSVEPLEAGQTEENAGNMPGGHETILLVEDEPSVLAITRKLLVDQGYKVLAAATPGEGIRLANENNGEIGLLITDVVMPEMNGQELAQKLSSLFPNLQKLFMSGYTADFIAHRGILEEGIHFIEKPFSLKDLAAKVREVLDTRLKS